MKPKAWKGAAARVAGFACAALALSCGGTENEARPERVALGVNELPYVDVGTGPYSCEQDDAYSVDVLEDFETGAATGWFTNNDICEACDRYKAYLSWFSKFRNCLYGEGEFKDDFVDPERPFEGITDINQATGKLCGDVVLDVTYRYTKEKLEGLSDKELDKLNQGFVDWIADEHQDYIGVIAAVYGGGADWLEDNAYDALPEEEQQRLKRSLLLRMDEAVVDMMDAMSAHPCRRTEDSPKDEITCEESQVPDWFAKPVIATEIPNGGRCGSRWALNLKTVALDVWGATAGRSFARGEPFNADDYDGVSFWARRGSQSLGTMRINLPDSRTTEKYFDLVTGEMPCNFISTLDDFHEDREACDAFGFVTEVGTDWKFFTIPFDKLRQAGFGKPETAFEARQIMGVEFSVQLGHWDIWIDDVGFYRKK